MVQLEPKQRDRNKHKEQNCLSGINTLGYIPVSKKSPHKPIRRDFCYCFWAVYTLNNSFPSNNPQVTPQELWFAGFNSPFTTSSESTLAKTREKLWAASFCHQ